MVKPHDYEFYTTTYYHTDGSARNDDDPFSSVSHLSCRKTYTKIYKILGKSPSRCSFWLTNHLLSEKCKYSYRYSRHSGINLHHSCNHTALLETPDALIYRRRNNLLYDNGTAYVKQTVPLCHSTINHYYFIAYSTSNLKTVLYHYYNNTRIHLYILLQYEENNYCNNL